MDVTAGGKRRGRTTATLRQAIVAAEEGASVVYLTHSPGFCNFVRARVLDLIREDYREGWVSTPKGGPFRHSSGGVLGIVSGFAAYKQIFPQEVVVIPDHYQVEERKNAWLAGFSDALSSESTPEIMSKTLESLCNSKRPRREWFAQRTRFKPPVGLLPSKNIPNVGYVEQGARGKDWYLCLPTFDESGVLTTGFVFVYLKREEIQ